MHWWWKLWRMIQEQWTLNITLSLHLGLFIQLYNSLGEKIDDEWMLNTFRWRWKCSLYFGSDIWVKDEIQCILCAQFCHQRSYYIEQYPEAFTLWGIWEVWGAWLTFNLFVWFGLANTTLIQLNEIKVVFVTLSTGRLPHRTAVNQPETPTNLSQPRWQHWQWYDVVG